MASGAKSHLCRICGGALQGNQRRWLFGGSSRRPHAGGPPGTPTGSHRSGSSLSSPWGSTLSLSSSGSLSRSQQSLTSSSSSSSSSKAVDLLAVLTHILGQAVPRGDGEFVCGKCVCLLERVFRFDTVISRVKVLSAERLQRLTQERDQIRQWVRQSYRRPRGGDGANGANGANGGGSRGSGDGGEAERDKEAYREMLRDNMALSQYECWSERWDTCPHFIRTGKRCRRGRGCEGCDALRVPDSTYESVSGVPRHLPFQLLSPLSRDKSRSMPLHRGSGPASLAGSTMSLRTLSRASSRTASVQSLDSLDCQDPCETLDFLLTELRGIEGNQLSSPAGSRIPVLGRGGGRSAWKLGGPASPPVSRTLDFREDGEDQLDGEDGDVLAELRDDFLPLHRENASRPLRRAVRTLEAQLDRGRSNGCHGNGVEEPPTLLPEDEGGRDALLQSFSLSLRSRERLIQECLVLISTLSEEHGSSPELSNALSHSLKELTSQNKEALRAVSSGLIQKQKNLQAELDTLREAGRDRDRDLDTLNAVLRRNRDVIDDLRAALQEKQRLLEEAQQEKELWRRRDGVLAAALEETEGRVSFLKEQLEERGSGGGASWEQRLGGGASLSRLTDCLQDQQQLLQTQQQSHAAAVSLLTNQLQEARRAQREEQSRRREEQRRQEEQQEEQRRLREALRSRDTLIQEILQEAERRDFLFTELQKKKHEPVTAVKHTL